MIHPMPTSLSSIPAVSSKVPKTESINTILQMAEYKKIDSHRKLIMTGCLGQRYAHELFEQMPEVMQLSEQNVMMPLGRVIDRVEKGERFVLLGSASKQYSQPKSRVLSTPQYTAYVKIAEALQQSLLLLCYSKNPGTISQPTL